MVKVQGSHLSIMSAPIVLTYHFSLVLLTERSSLILDITVAEHFVYGLMSFFFSALLGGPNHVTYDFERATSLVESGVLLYLQSSIHSFVSGVGLFSLLRGSQLHYGPAYLAYYRSLKVNWDDESFVRWFSYTSLSSEGLDIPPREIIFTKRNIRHIQVIHILRSVPVQFKPGRRNRFETVRPTVDTS